MACAGNDGHSAGQLFCHRTAPIIPAGSYSCSCGLKWRLQSWPIDPSTRGWEMTGIGFCAKPAWLALSAACTALAMIVGSAEAADKLVFVTDYGLYGRH